MRNFIVLLLITFPILLSAQIRADFTFSRYYAPGQGGYIETYLNIDGNSLNYALNENGMYQGKLEVSIAFFKGDTAVAFDKYEVLTPLLNNPDSAVADVLDQKRFLLPDGKYEMEINMIDVNDTAKTPINGSYSVGIGSSDSVMFLSDIMYVYDYEKADPNDPFQKAGLKLTPHVFDLYDDNSNKLTFYLEAYNSNRILSDSQKVAINYYLKDQKTKKLITEYGGINTYNPKEVLVVFKTIDINNLPSGNYELWIEAIDKDGKRLAEQSISFTRINYHNKTTENVTLTGTFQDWVMNINSLDSLSEMCWCLFPIADQNEAQYLKNNKDNPDLNFYKNYFINFWSDRDPVNPWEKWLAYETEVKKVNSEYTTSDSKGYETDRGFIYLKYGAPNTITKRDNEPNSYPYHIWHYYQHPKRSDAKYVFYSKDRSTNDYVILHSNVIGEINNYHWKIDLQRRNTPYGSIDEEDVDDQWGNWSEDLFNMPR